MEEVFIHGAKRVRDILNLASDEAAQRSKQYDQILKIHLRNDTKIFMGLKISQNEEKRQ